MREKYGSLAKYREHQREIGGKGGKAKVAKGYSHPRNADKRRYTINKSTEG